MIGFYINLAQIERSYIIIITTLIIVIIITHKLLSHKYSSKANDTNGK